MIARDPSKTKSEHCMCFKRENIISWQNCKTCEIVARESFFPTWLATFTWMFLLLASVFKQIAFMLKGFSAALKERNRRAQYPAGNNQYLSVQRAFLNHPIQLAGHPQDVYYFRASVV